MRSTLFGIIASGGGVTLPDTNLILDVEPDLYGVADTAITELTNSVVGQNDGIQANGANRATFRANEQGGKGAAEFDGTDYYDFGDIFDSLTAGSFYFYGKLNLEPPADGYVGLWQPTAAGGSETYLAHDGAGTISTQKMFSNVTRGSGYIGETLADQYFLYEIHASGTNWEMVLNTVTIQSTSANTFTANSGFLFGTSLGLFLKARTARVLGYSAAHNEASRQSVRNYIESYYTGDVNDHFATNIICEGTSITVSFPYSTSNSPISAYPGQLATSIEGNYVTRAVLEPESADGSYIGSYNRRRSYRVRNIGAGGALIQDMIDGFTDQVEAHLAAGKTNIVVLEAGTNDIEAPQLQNAAYINGKIDEYAALCAGVGATLYVHHIMSRGWDGDFAAKDAVRTSVNAHIAANYNDIPTPTELTDYSNTTYFQDGIHPTAAGYVILATATETALGL